MGDRMSYSEPIQAFREAGIGRKYDRYKLGQLEDVSDVITFVQNDMETHIEEGKPIWITGEYRKADVVAHCVLKSAVARDFRVRMMTPEDLRREMDEDDTDLFDLDLIGMLDFDDPHYPTNPYNPETARQMEDTLMRLIRLERSVLFHMTPETPWWSKRLRDEIENNAMQFIVMGGLE